MNPNRYEEISNHAFRFIDENYNYEVKAREYEKYIISVANRID